MKAGVVFIVWHSEQAVLSIDSHFHPQSSTTRLVTGGGDNVVRIWKVNEKGEQNKGNSSGSNENKQKSSSNVILCASLNRHTNPVNVVRFSPRQVETSNNQIPAITLASGADDGTIIIWKLTSLEKKQTFDEEEESLETWSSITMLRGGSDIYDLAWSPDISMIVSGSIDHSVKIWDLHKKSSTHTFNDHTHYVQGVAWDPLNNYVVSQSCDRTCRVYKKGGKGARHTFHLSNKIEKILLDKDMKAVNKVEIEENNENNEKESSQNQWKMFADDSLPTFFRRMTFSPDGTLLFLPSGIFRSKSKDSENTTEVLNTVYIFSRNNFSRPIAHLPGLKKPTLIVKCCPLLFELRQMKNGTYESFISLKSQSGKKYRIVYAVASIDSIVLYDTQQIYPLAYLTNFHYSAITDLTWSSNGLSLWISSRDGFCSHIEFDEGELGTPIPQELSSIPNVTIDHMEIDEVKVKEDQIKETEKLNEIQTPGKEKEKVIEPSNTQITDLQQNASQMSPLKRSASDDPNEQNKKRRIVPKLISELPQ